MTPSVRDWGMSTNVDSSKKGSVENTSKTHARASLKEIHMEDKESWASLKYEQQTVAIT